MKPGSTNWRRIRELVLLLIACCGVGRAFAQPAFEVWYDEALDAGPFTGRVLLLLTTLDVDGRASDPLGAPFWADPQPIYSIAVANLKPGERAAVIGSTSGYPGRLSDLRGRFRVRAVLDVDTTTSGFSRSAKNLHSDALDVELTDTCTRPIAIQLTQRFRTRGVQSTDRVKLVEFTSPSLSAFFGRPFVMRAGVVLPPDYEDQPSKLYPAVYHVPGFGGSHQSAWWAVRRGRGESHRLDECAIHVHLDPDGPFGHHLFVNSENNGPVGDALVREFIPYLEREFRLIPESEARLLTGHSSGGFTTASLQVNYPEFFGGCWSTSPDPVDFRAFQSFNIYEDVNVYVDPDGRARRSVVMDSEVKCTTKQEMRMEDALHPRNASGEQWDSWIACFSPRDTDGYPKDLWNPETGVIDHDVADYWQQRDLRYILESRWETIGPVIAKRLRIIVGDADNFDLHRAVIRLRDDLDDLPGWSSTRETLDERAGNGYIEILPGRTHFDLQRDGLGERIKDEMVRSFEMHGLLNRLTGSTDH